MIYTRCSIDDRNYDRLSHISLDQDPHQFELRRCKFPGAKLFGAVGSLVRYKTEVEALDTISRETQGWLTSYNIRHNYTSPWRLNEVLSGHSDLQSSLNQYREKTSRTLSTVFEKSTVSFLEKIELTGLKIRVLKYNTWILKFGNSVRYPKREESKIVIFSFGLMLRVFQNQIPMYSVQVLKSMYVCIVFQKSDFQIR